MNAISSLVIILLVLALLPVMLKVLDQILPALRERLDIALPAIAGMMRRAFRWAGNLITDQGSLSPARAVAQTSGALLMTAAGVALGFCDFEFALAALCPLLGVPCAEGPTVDFSLLLGLSIVLLLLAFGLVLTDLSGWTYLSPFALTERGRIPAICIVFFCFVTTIAVAVLLARYRDQVLAMTGDTAQLESAAAEVQKLTPAILLPLAALLSIGTLVTFMSLETLAAGATALLTALWGVVLGGLWVGLSLFSVLAELLLKAVRTFIQTIEEIHRSFLGGTRRAASVMANGRNALVARLHHWFRPASPVRTTPNTNASGPAMDQH
jgi:hypothetical protein